MYILASKLNQNIEKTLKLENWIYEGLLMAHEEYQKEYYKSIAEVLNKLVKK